MQTVTRHAWTNDARKQVQLGKGGQCQFSHTQDLPLRIATNREGWLCRKVLVTTVEEIWFRDAVCMITIPSGFQCDLASIPRWLWCLVSPYDLAYEGLLHDQIYRTQEVTRQYADFLFLHVMGLRGVPWYVRYSCWLAVRLFGKKAWEKNRKRLERKK